MAVKRPSNDVQGAELPPTKKGRMSNSDLEAERFISPTILQISSPYLYLAGPAAEIKVEFFGDIENKCRPYKFQGLQADFSGYYVIFPSSKAGRKNAWLCYDKFKAGHFCEFRDRSKGNVIHFTKLFAPRNTPS